MTGECPPLFSLSLDMMESFESFLHKMCGLRGDLLIRGCSFIAQVNLSCLF